MRRRRRVRLRDARAADPPRAAHLRGARAALPRVPAAADLPRGPAAARARMSDDALRWRTPAAARRPVPDRDRRPARASPSRSTPSTAATPASTSCPPSCSSAERARLLRLPVGADAALPPGDGGLGKLVGFELWKLRLLNVAHLLRRGAGAAAAAAPRDLAGASCRPSPSRWPSRCRPTSSAPRSRCSPTTWRSCSRCSRSSASTATRRTGRWPRSRSPACSAAAAVLTRQSFLWVALVAAAFLVLREWRSPARRRGPRAARPRRSRRSRRWRSSGTASCRRAPTRPRAGSARTSPASAATRSRCARSASRSRCSGCTRRWCSAPGWRGARGGSTAPRSRVARRRWPSAWRCC